MYLPDNSERYEELRKLKDEAEENTIFSLQKKKGYAAEKKQVREQKEEAERFNGKLEQLKVQQQEYYLFQLFNVHQEMNGHQEKIESLEETREETQAREATAEDRLKSAKKAHGKLNQQLAASEKVAYLRTFFVFGAFYSPSHRPLFSSFLKLCFNSFT